MCWLAATTDAFDVWIFFARNVTMPVAPKQLESGGAEIPAQSTRNMFTASQLPHFSVVLPPPTLEGLHIPR